MANVNSPNGFTPVRHLTGGTIRTQEMPIVHTTAAAIFTGDLVMMSASLGYIKVGTTTSGLDACGVFAGCRFRNAAGEYVFSKYWPAGQTTLGNEDAIGYVYNDPNIVFACQTTTTGALAENGQLFDLTATAGSTNTGHSKQAMNEGASSEDQFRQIGLQKVGDNAWGSYARVEVLFHEHVYLPAAGVEA